ncbi:hypothetical protein HMPREF9374_0191 [Desmospora sp. 8437]|nr:hypothetical protein HMPREF9374_0191 [Desmospora sp. 8437]
MEGQKLNPRGNFSIRIEGNVEQGSFIGNFSESNILYQNQPQTKELKEKQLEQLIGDFIKLTNSCNQIPEREIQTSIELLKHNHQMIKDGKPNKTLINSSKLHLKNIKEKLSNNTPLLANISDITQILSFFCS